MLSRRRFGLGALLSAPLLAAPSLPAAAAEDRTGAICRALLDLETRHGCRLGAAILDSATMRLVTHRGDERFAMCSTWKALAAAFVLARVDCGDDRLDRHIVYAKADLVAYSPITGDHAGEPGLTLEELCDAAVTRSDNTAANLLLDSFGGPAALTAYVRTLGDGITRLDRREPELNEAAPGDPRDTTTPAATVRLLHTIVLGSALSSGARAQLTAWLLANTTGANSLRAGIPPAWRVGDKTGSTRNIANDIALVWPPGRAPIMVAAYCVGGASDAVRKHVLAEVGRLATTA